MMQTQTSQTPTEAEYARCALEAAESRMDVRGLNLWYGDFQALKGIDLSIVDKNSGRGSAVPPDARYSTLQDIDAGRHTEIDMFSGALMRMGKELGIPTPYNEYTYHMIKALEDSKECLFRPFLT